ncbi:MAG: hypothetical protein P1V97_05810 [Planctomycetota bacterium]|nr:hypothetical protein [Planctomycetota bacterium]
MRIATKWLVVGALGLASLVGCTPNNSDSIDEGGSAVLLFEVEAARVENHVFPNDQYLDRSFVNAVGAPLLAGPTAQAALGPTGVNTNDGGFTATQVANAAFLNQFATGAQNAWAATTDIRIPFSNNSSDIDNLNPESVDNTNAILVFELGVPVYTAGATVAPPVFLTDAGVPTSSTTLVPVALNSPQLNIPANSLKITPQAPFRTSALDPLGRRTFAVVVLDNGSLRTKRNGPILPSNQYTAIRNGDITVLPAAEQTAVTRYINDTALGFGLVSTRLATSLGIANFGRSNTLAYFEFTVRDDTQPLVLLRSIINGNVNVDRTAIGGTASEAIGVNEPNGISTAPTNGFDTIDQAPTDPNNDDPTVLTGQTALMAAFPGIPTSAIGRAVLGFITTPNFVSTPTLLTNPVDPTNTTALGFNQRFLGSGAVTIAAPNVPNGNTLQIAAAATPFNSSTNLLRQFPAVDGNQVFSMTNPNFNTVLTDANGGLFTTNRLPYLLLIPATAQPANGYPVVIVQHGFSRQKEDILAIANSFCSAGFAVIGIDVYQHGARQAFDGGNSTKLDPVAGGQNLPDPFLNPSFPYRTAAKFKQTIADQLSLVVALSNAAVEFDPSSAALNFDATNINYFGLSLGGILGTTLTAIEPNIGRAVLNVPGGSLTTVATQSAEISPTLDGLILAIGNAVPLAGTIVPLSINSGIRDTFNIFVGTALGCVDPGTFASRLLSPQNATLPMLNNLRGAAPPTVLFQFVLGDTVVPNRANSYLAKGVEVGSATFAEVATAGTVIPDPNNPMNTLTINEPFQFSTGVRRAAMTAGPANPQTGSFILQYGNGAVHGSGFSPTASPVQTTAMQQQATVFFASGTVQ